MLTHGFFHQEDQYSTIQQKITTNQQPKTPHTTLKMTAKILMPRRGRQLICNGLLADHSRQAVNSVYV